MAAPSGYLASLGFRRRGRGLAIVCTACGQGYDRAQGDVMRGHRRRCPVDPREVPTPGVCDA